MATTVPFTRIFTTFYVFADLGIVSEAIVQDATQPAEEKKAQSTKIAVVKINHLDAFINGLTLCAILEAEGFSAEP